MAAKLNIEGVLVYFAMLSYLAGAAVRLLNARKGAWAVFFLGFVFAAAALGVRWRSTGHVPLQSLYEVFLSLGMLIFPISVFCARFLGTGAMAGDCVIGLIVLFPAGFVFGGEPRELPPALQSGLFIPHVAAYLAAYVILSKAAVQAAAQLLAKGGGQGGALSYEAAACKMVRLGFPLLTAGLVLGAWWGKTAWGDYWNWDPKELWSLATWLTYLGYLHFRHVDGQKHPRVNSAIVLAGLAGIVITLVWVNLARAFAGGLHDYAT